MDKTKLKLVPKVIGAFALAVSLGWGFYPADAALVVQNVEALTNEEFDALEHCTKAGGYCNISEDQSYRGISIED